MDDDYYDDDFHEFSGGSGEFSGPMSHSSPRQEQPQYGNLTSDREENAGTEDGTHRQIEENSLHKDNFESNKLDQYDEEGQEDGDEDNHIETEVDPHSGILKLGQPIENIRDERLEMSGGRFKFPDELSRDDLGLSGDDHFRDIYASPTQQQYIDGTIRALNGGNNQKSQLKDIHLMSNGGATAYSDRFEDEDLSESENQGAIYQYVDNQHSQPHQQRKQPRQLMKGDGKVLRKNPARKERLIGGFAGGPSIQKQFDLALKRLHVAERERKLLEQKLNASAAQAELVRLRSLADQQGKRLKSLEADKRALEGRMRHQAHKLQEAEAGMEKLRDYGNNSSMSSERQIEILLERVRRLTAQVKQLREQGKEKDARLKSQGQKVQKLKAYIESHIKQHLKVNQASSGVHDSVTSRTHYNEDDLSLIDGGSMFTADANVEGMSELQALRHQLDQLDNDASLVSGPARMQDSDTATGKDKEAVLRRSVTQLKRSLAVQRKGFTKEIRDLQHELKESRQNEERLEKLLDERERHAHAQVLAVKQLRQTCEELEEGNNRLMLASDIYSRPVQPQEAEVTAHVREPEHPSIEYVIRGGPVMHPTKPSRPSGNSSRPIPPGRKLQRSVRDENHGSSGKVFL